MRRFNSLKILKDNNVKVTRSLGSTCVWLMEWEHGTCWIHTPDPVHVREAAALYVNLYLLGLGIVECHQLMVEFISLLEAK